MSASFSRHMAVLQGWGAALTTSMKALATSKESLYSAPVNLWDSKLQTHEGSEVDE